MADIAQWWLAAFQKGNITMDNQLDGWFPSNWINHPWCKLIFNKGKSPHGEIPPRLRELETLSSWMVAVFCPSVLGTNSRGIGHPSDTQAQGIRLGYFSLGISGWWLVQPSVLLRLHAARWVISHPKNICYSTNFLNTGKKRTNV